jgi:hypothetical protein
MARNQENTTEYFSHDANPERVIKTIENRYGNDGYAFIYKLQELLCLEDGHYLNCNDPLAWQYLISYTHVSEITGTEILNLLASVGFLSQKLWKLKKVVFCKGLVDRFKDVYQKRKRELPTEPSLDLFDSWVQESPAAGISGTEMRADLPSADIPGGNNHQSKVKGSEVKKSKEKEVKKKDGGGQVNKLAHVVELIASIEAGWWIEFNNDFSDIDIQNEIKGFRDYWSGPKSKKELTNVKLALRNWMKKAQQIKQESANGINSKNNNGHAGVTNQGDSLADLERFANS